MDFHLYEHGNKKEDMKNKRSIGTWGEEVAARFLLQKGYRLICRNFHARLGEIDLIAWHEKELFGETLCFIEVKTRQNIDGLAERAVNRRKRQHMAKAATYFCVKQGINQWQTPIAFEQVSVYMGDPVRARVLTIPDVSFDR